MSLGFDAIAALPFATSGPDTDVIVSTTGNALTITIGSVGIIGVNIIGITSDALTSGLGTLTATGHSNIAVTGVYGTGHVNQLLVWGIIDDDQDPNWTGVSDSQDPSWTGVSDSQDPNWKDIAA